MTPEQYRAILSKAIEREVESYTYYRTISDKVKDAYLKKIFADLAGDETEQGGLAGAVAPHHPEAPAGVGGEAHAGEQGARPA
ncbi:MAG TPA: hypothetical protein PLK38_03765, partial [Methanoregulaceae archaeon]|nr:hypothetical protein [Methanoregulaceae archaeon]